MNRLPHSSSAFDQSCIEARNIFHAFLDQLINLTQECVSRYDRALVIDFYGFTKPTAEYPDIIFGHMFGKTLDLVQNDDREDCDKFWDCIQLCNELSNLIFLVLIMGL